MFQALFALSASVNEGSPLVSMLAPMYLRANAGQARAGPAHPARNLPQQVELCESGPSPPPKVGRRRGGPGRCQRAHPHRGRSIVTGRRYDQAMPAAARRFPAPWSIEEMPDCFVVEIEKNRRWPVCISRMGGRRASAKLLSKDDAWRIASNIAKLPHVPRQILKDIPRPKIRLAKTRGRQ